MSWQCRNKTEILSRVIPSFSEFTGNTEENCGGKSRYPEFVTDFS